MDAKKLLLGVLTASIGLVLLWLLRRLDPVEPVDYKELYRQAFHTQADEMEERMRKRREQTN